jgi:diguanylate cyclase (GGDEF)-like protein
VAIFAQERSEADEFDWIDGDQVRGRHYRIRLARLVALRSNSVRLVLSALDRTAEIENERSLRAEMTHDSLTGLPNRTAFGEALAGTIDASGAAGTAPEVAVLIVDLARFSRVNECMGSTVGDELIITVARRLVGTIRGGDLLAPIGGDEFAILINLGQGRDEAMLAANRIQAVCRRPSGCPTWRSGSTARSAARFPTALSTIPPSCCATPSSP